MSYSPRDVPSTLEQLPQYLQDELWNIARGMAADPSYTEAQLLDKDSQVNRKLKGAGVRVWDSTNKRPVWATGKEPTATWVDGNGTVALSPV